MLIRAYGLFWRTDEIDWFPGGGPTRRFLLLGRRGKNLPSLRVADFRAESGLYILYGNYGPYYVGRADKLGRRLKQHMSDRHAGKWDRFSWFGFRAVLNGTDDRGLSKLKQQRSKNVGRTDRHIGELEALLIRALGLESNYAKMKFPGAEAWVQVKEHEVEHYLSKVAPR